MLNHFRPEQALLAALLNILYFRKSGLIDITAVVIFQFLSGEPPAAQKWILFWETLTLLSKLNLPKFRRTRQKDCICSWKNTAAKKASSFPERLLQERSHRIL